MLRTQVFAGTLGGSCRVLDEPAPACHDSTISRAGRERGSKGNLMHNRIITTFLIACASVAELFFTQGIAHAAWSGNFTTSVSCDGVTSKTGISVAHQGGTIGFKQVTTSPTSGSRAQMVRSSDRRQTSQKNLSNGTHATWGSQPSGLWYPRMLRTGAYNCNGVLPGHGNYSLTYNISYTG